MENEIHPKWMKTVLVLAGVYNLIWGAWIVLRPLDLFHFTGIDPPLYPGIWQCVGMVIGVYGIGYLIASTDPLRHWPIVLVGFLGKVFGPIGMVAQIAGVPLSPIAGQTGQTLPPSWLWLNLTNDLIWWVPFAAILYAAFRLGTAPATNPGLTTSPGPANPTESNPAASFAEVCQNARTQSGRSLAEWSADRNVLLVFLRHSGCTFCREALADLAEHRSEIEDNATLVLVHMQSESEQSQSFFAGYELGDVPRISDPDCRLYRTFELQRGKFSQLFGFGVWRRGFVAAILKRHLVGKLNGDGFQMPGAFVLRNSKIIDAFRHQNAAERPDYCELAIHRE